MGLIKCEKCGKTFDFEKYYGLCPKCGRYNKENKSSNNCEINGDLSYEHLMEHKNTTYSSNPSNESTNVHTEEREFVPDINNMSYREMREQGQDAQRQADNKAVSLIIKIFIGFMLFPLFINVIMGVIAAIFLFVS